MIKLVQLTLLAVLIPTLCLGEENISRQAKGEHSGTEALSPELREIYSREMVELQNGMIAIIPLYISGNLDEIAKIARKMESSYVLQQNLSKSQVHELHSKLPGSFMMLDQQFHYLAGMLEHVANMEKIELVGFYISKMSETCVRCHTEYATHRFPALAPKRQDEHSH
jgi:hypothetical protein